MKPSVLLIGLALFKFGAPVAGTHWGIGGLTIGLIILFSQYMRRTHRAFELFPIMLGILVAWGIAALLTAVGVFGLISLRRLPVDVEGLWVVMAREGHDFIFRELNRFTRKLIAYCVVFEPFDIRTCAAHL